MSPQKLLPVSCAQAKRILLIGPSCSGKTTLSQKLGQILNLPAYDLDDLHWLPDWKARELDDFRAQVKQVVDQERWILAGNYSRSQDLSWPRAELILWLDFEKALILRRFFKRTLWRYLSHTASCNGNYESLKTIFGKDSLYRWIQDTHQLQRDRYQERLASDPDKVCVRLTDPQAVQALLRQFSQMQEIP